MKKNVFLMAGVAPAVLGMALISAPAFAQQSDIETTVANDQQEVEPEQQNRGEAIVVTGSRIASPSVTSAAPLQILDSESIDNSGVTNIQDLLLENPVFGVPALSRTNSAFLTSGTGAATVDLRDLGSDRTLVLINGRRVVAGLPGSATVDLNVIPTQFVERIDVLTGGASSLYGSDAVAGVVNFIYKKDFEGIEANGQYGITERGDDRRYQANLTVGTNVADGRGNVMVHFGYSNEGGVLSRQRRNTFLDDADTAAFVTGDLADFGVPTEPFFSSFPTQGRFDAGGTRFTYDNNGNLKTGFSTNGPNGDGVNADGFNRQFFRTIAVPVERYLFAASGEYEIVNDINLFFEGTFNKTTSSRIIEPFALSSENIFGNNGGVIPIETFVNGVATLNPLVPGPIAAAATDTDEDGLRDITFARRIAEFGPRQGSTTRDFYRFVVGLDGKLFNDNFRWDVSYNYGRTSESQRSSGQVNTPNFRFAFAAIPDVNDVNNNGSTTDAICADATARERGCVPINIFGAGAITPEALQYTNAEQTFQTEITQQVVQGNISGSLFELPGGPLGVALGVEYRKETSIEDSDALTNAGLNAGNAIPDTQGSFDVSEAFAEVKLPLLADVPFFHYLEVGGAVRVADYSTVGTIFSYNGTGTWQPIEDVRIRGSYARSVRAPNIGELFSGLSQTFPSGLSDPCLNAANRTNCLNAAGLASAGVAANVAANGGNFVLTQGDLQGISGFNGGNPDLNEEKSTSWTVGGVITPRSIEALRNLSLSVDYWNIKIDNVIAAPPRQFILDQCFGQGNNDFCQFVSRRANPTAVNSPGSIEFLNALLINSASLKTDGIDAVLNYRTALDTFGVQGGLRAQIAYTHLFNYDFKPTSVADVDPAAGEIGNAKDRFTANLGYDAGPFGINFTGTFIGKSYEDNNFCASFDAGPRCVGVGSEFYLDTQARFRATDQFEFYLGVDNLLDNKAPNLLSGTTFNVTGTDTAADVYDVFGRRYYTGVRLRF